MYRVVLVGVVVEEVIISFRSRFLIFLYFPVKQRCAIVLLCCFQITILPSVLLEKEKMKRRYNTTLVYIVMKIGKFFVHLAFALSKQEKK